MILGILLLPLTIAAANPASTCSPAVIAADRARIRAHLENVERELRAREVSELSAAARAARSAALAALHRYWEAGEFPHNLASTGPEPIFIDRDGRPCAVAYLMLRSGATDLVQEISRKENRAHVLDMRTDLTAWLTANGLSAQEAALIQPVYASCSDEYRPICASKMVDGGQQEVTFGNRCVLDCGVSSTVPPSERFQYLHDGVCEGQASPTLSGGRIVPDESCVEDSAKYGCDCGIAAGSTGSSWGDAGLAIGILSLTLLRSARRRRAQP